MIQANSYEQFRKEKKVGWIIFEEVNLICFGQDSWQFNSDSIHLDFTMLRFNSDSIQHILDSIQTQFTSASSVSDSTQNSQKMLNWIGIDSESELIHTSLVLLLSHDIVVELFSVIEQVTVFDCWLKFLAYRAPIKQDKASVRHYFALAALQFKRGYWFLIVLTCRFS